MCLDEMQSLHNYENLKCLSSYNVLIEMKLKQLMN